MFHQENSGGAADSRTDRLDSWKEIALYLKRDVSTLHRWEKEEGLPVHRMHHKHSASVYAFRSELDEWCSGREDSPETAAGSEGRSIAYRDLALVSLSLLILALLWWRPSLDSWFLPAGLEFHDRDWVLITNFENATGESLFDGTLEEALERELANSSYVNVVPGPRIQDSLTLMKRSVDAFLDVNLAREVALRDGGISVVLAGRIDESDGSILLSLKLVNPRDGVILAARSESIPESDWAEVLKRVRGLSNWVRETLGEADSSVRGGEAELSRVTTPSLKALQLFTKADRLERQTAHERAEELLKAALVEDPDFAAALCWLAWTLRNQGRSREEYLEPARRALELSDGVSERERYIIRGSYHLLEGDYEAARPIWEALLERYPEDYWGNNNLVEVYRGLGEFDQAFEQMIRLAEVRPNDFLTVAQASFIVLKQRGDLALAGFYAHKASEILTQEGAENAPFYVAWVEFFPAFEKWLGGDIGGALNEVDILAGTIPLRGLWLREPLSLFVGYFYFLLGMDEKAQSVLPPLDPQHGHYFPCWKMPPTDFLGEGSCLSPQALECIRKNPVGEPAVDAFVELCAARPEAAERVLGSIVLPYSWNGLERGRFSGFGPGSMPGREQVVRGHLLLAQGKKRLAIQTLEQGLNHYKTGFTDTLFYVESELLARLLEEQGDVEEAVRVLNVVSASKNRVSGYTASFWVRNEWLLARLYRRIGQYDEAQQKESELLQLLAYADPGHPYLVDILANESPVP